MLKFTKNILNLANGHYEELRESKAISQLIKYFRSKSFKSKFDGFSRLHKAIFLKN